MKYGISVEFYEGSCALKMGTIEVNSYNLKEYIDILGPDMAENIGRKDFFALAAGEKGESILMWRNLFYIGKEYTADILFLKAENKELGKELLLECVKRCSERNIKQYHVAMSGINDIEMGLLKSFGIIVKQVESKDITASLSDIEANRLLTIGEAKGAVSISALTYPEFRKQLTKALLKNKRGLEEDIANLPMRWYDQDVSCAMVHDGKTNGLFLVHKLPSGVLRPVFLYSDGEEAAKDMLVMLRYAMEEALKKYAPDTNISINRRTAEISTMTERLLNGKKLFRVFEGNVSF